MRAVVEANLRLALAVFVVRPNDERGFAAGDAEACRGLRLDAAPPEGRVVPDPAAIDTGVNQALGRTFSERGSNDSAHTLC